MAIDTSKLDRVEPSEIAAAVREAGVAGAGGAGFPTYAKWDRLDDVDYLLVNHQESEPVYHKDKWLGRERAAELGSLFDALLEEALDLIVISAKEKFRDGWMDALEEVTDGTVYGPEETPIDPEAESGVVFAYSEDRYQLGMESVLLRTVADVVMGSDLPMDHGWIVQNTETLSNACRALRDGTPVTTKYLHVAGDVPRHRFLEVPMGTPGDALLEAAGLSPAEFGAEQVMADGGPGWCFEIEGPPAAFGVRKRTNCLLVLDEETVRENTYGGERINVLDTREWTVGDAETEPSRIDPPEYVRVPLITNDSLIGIVSPSEPVVDPGDEVSAGDVIARAADEGIGIPQHASVDGEIGEVTDRHVEIRR